MLSLINGRTAAFALFIACSVAIPSNAQTGVISKFFQLNSGSYLGIQMEDVTASDLSRYKLNSERGVIVRSVMEGSPAEEAGLQEGDVILEFAGVRVRSCAQLSRLVQETPPGRKVDLVISRDGKEINLTVRVEDREGREFDGPMGSSARRFIAPDERFFQFRIPGRPDNSRPRLGLTVQPLTDQLAEYFGVEGKAGVLVSSVAEGSPSSGKILTGDVIVAADGKKIEDPEDLVEIVQDRSEGAVSLTVIREKREITVVVYLTADGTRGTRL